jgi:hypothetical protein
VPILTRPHAVRLDGTDPVAASLRSLLAADPLIVRAVERQAEIRRFVQANRLATLAAAPSAPRPTRGLRRAVARALFALVERLAPDVVSPDPCA